MTLDSLCKQYEKTLRYEFNYSSATIKRYVYNVTQLGKFLAGQYFNGKFPGVDKIQLLHIRRYLTYLSRERNCQTTTIVSNIWDLRAFFNYAHRMGEIKINPMDKIKLPSLPQKPPRFLSVEEIKALFSAVDVSKYTGFRDLVILKTLYYTGLRAGEIANLKVSDLDNKLETIHVNEGKGRKDRMVPIHSYLSQYLKKYLALKKDLSPYLFTSSRGNGITKHYVATLVKKYVRKAGLLNNITPHSFRHSFATHLVQEGVKIHHVGDLLGHDSIDTTLVYTHRTVEDLKRLVMNL